MDGESDGEGDSGSDGIGGFEGSDDGSDGIEGFGPGQVADSGGLASSASSGKGLSTSSKGLGLSATAGPGLSMAQTTGAPGLQAPGGFAGGINAPSLDSNTQAAVTSAAIAVGIAEAEAAAAAAAAAAAKQKAAIDVGKKALGIAAPAVAGVIGIAELAVNALSAFFGGESQGSKASDTAGSQSNQGNGAMSDPYSGGNGGDFATSIDAAPSSPVLGFGGAVVNSPSTGAVSGYAPALFPSMLSAAQGGGLRNAAGFVTAPQSSSGASQGLPVAVLVSVFSYLFFGA